MSGIIDWWQWEALVATYGAFLCTLGSLLLVRRQDPATLMRVLRGLLLIYVWHFGCLMVLDTTFLHLLPEVSTWSWWRRLYARNALALIHGGVLLALWIGRQPCAAVTGETSDQHNEITQHVEAIGARVEHQLRQIQQHQDGQALLIEQILRTQRGILQYLTAHHTHVTAAPPEDAPPEAASTVSVCRNTRSV